MRDLESARKFYVEKLGFEVRTEETVGGTRWLTVGPGPQPEIEIVLMQSSGDRKLCGVFETDDCKSSYELMKGRGVEFVTPPEERPYGIEAVFKDDSGNWLSLCRRRR